MTQSLTSLIAIISQLVQISTSYHFCNLRYYAYYSRKKVYARRVKGALSGLRQFLTTEIPLKMIKNLIYFTQKLPLF